MRVGELVQLKISDIDFDSKPTRIKIRAETTKTRESRETYLTEEATKAPGPPRVNPSNPPRKAPLAVIEYINEIRASYNRDRIVWDQRLYELALVWTKDMYQYEFLDHTNPITGQCPNTLKENFGKLLTSNHMKYCHN